jgi:hypothetical protein
MPRTLAGTEGREGAKGRVQASVDWEPEARLSPRAPSSGGRCAQARLDSWPESTHERTQWV